MSRCSSSGRAISAATLIRRPAVWCSTAPSACATPGPRSAGAGAEGRRSVPAEQPDQLALNAHSIGREDAHLIGGGGRLPRARGAPPPGAPQGLPLLIDQAPPPHPRLRPGGLT